MGNGHHVGAIPAHSVAKLALYRTWVVCSKSITSRCRGGEVIVMSATNLPSGSQRFYWCGFACHVIRPVSTVAHKPTIDLAVMTPRCKTP